MKPLASVAYWPSGLKRMTLLPPYEPAGTVQVTVVALTTVGDAHELPLICTVAPARKLAPVSVTVTLPASGPVLGARNASEGGWPAR